MAAHHTDRISLPRPERDAVASSAAFTPATGEEPALTRRERRAARKPNRSAGVPGSGKGVPAGKVQGAGVVVTRRQYAARRTG